MPTADLRNFPRPQRLHQSAAGLERCQECALSGIDCIGCGWLHRLRLIASLAAASTNVGHICHVCLQGLQYGFGDRLLVDGADFAIPPGAIVGKWTL